MANGNPNARSYNSTQMKEARAMREPIPDYGNMPIPHLERVKRSLGTRLKEYSGTYYLDGKRVLVGDLMRMGDV